MLRSRCHSCVEGTAGDSHSNACPGARGLCHLRLMSPAPRLETSPEQQTGASKDPAKPALVLASVWSRGERPAREGQPGRPAPAAARLWQPPRHGAGLAEPQGHPSGRQQRRLPRISACLGHRRPTPRSRMMSPPSRKSSSS